MSDPQAVIAATIREHIYDDWHITEAEQCSCHGCGTSYEAHLAAEIDKALGGLREEVEQRGAYIRRADGTSVPAVTVRRYTTPYTPEGNQ